MQGGHFSSESSTMALSSTSSSHQDEAMMAAKTYPDLYCGNTASNLQYYYNAYSWPSHHHAGTTNGSAGSSLQDQTSHHAGGANMLLQYTAASHNGHFYPMYPGVITAAFGGDVHHGDHAGSSNVAFDPCILELRKEKSRDAARSRRGKENYEFYELAKMLPLPGAITSQLDKASIIRLTISFLKLRDFSGHGDPPWQRDPHNGGNKGSKANPSRRRNAISMPTDIFETHQGTHILQSLDGFAFALSNDGRFLYISETVSIYLGLSQVEMTGSNFFDYIHTADHQEVAEQLGLNTQGLYPSSGGPGGSGTSTTDTGEGGNSNSSTSRAVTPTLPERTSVMNPSPSKGYDRCFCVRMKSTLTKRGVHVKSSGYRVVQILAHMRPQFSFSLARKHPPQLLGLVGMAIALPPPTMTELVIDNDMFVTRLSPDLKITYCEPRIADMMDISADDLTNKNLYDYCHAEDLQKLRRAHVDILGKGQVLTDYYRLMNKHGGYIWVQTCATVICNSKNVDEQNIIAINYVLSGMEYSGCVMNLNQLKVVSKMEPDQSDHSETEQFDRSRRTRQDHKNQEEKKLSFHHNHQNGEERSQQRGSKRKHANNTNKGCPEPAPHNPHSPVNSFDLLYQKHKSITKDNNAAIATATNSVVVTLHKHDALEKQVLDLKNNSRRKMEKPRKRKRDQNDPDPEGAGTNNNNNKVDLSLSAVDGSSDFNAPDPLGGLVEPLVQAGSRPSSSHSLAPPGSPGQLRVHSSPPVAEDLSMRTSQSPLVVAAVSPQHRSLTPVVDSHVTDNPLVEPAAPIISASPVLGGGDPALRQSWAGSTPEGGPLGEVAGPCGSSSVRDLEEAMNKHLPTAPSEADHIRASLAAAADSYSQSMLPGAAHNKNKSTIQWIGSQPPASSDSALPATNLLRSLYVNRESVIRPNIYNPRPQYYSGDNTLLTPPGGATDTSYSAAKTSPTAANYAGLNYSTSPINAAAMATTNMADAYAMTPPSSVSPQEKYPFVTPESYHSDVMRGGYDATLPIKPQAYPLPAHANSGYDRAATTAVGQYGNPAGYYGASFTPYNHSASPTPAHYRDMRASNVW